MNNQEIPALYPAAEVPTRVDELKYVEPYTNANSHGPRDLPPARKPLREPAYFLLQYIPMASMPTK